MESLLCVEYLDKASLDGFLFQRKKDENGLLQKFIRPAGAHNNTIRCVWSKQFLLTERCENKFKLNDSSKPLLERAVTFDGAEIQVSRAPLRGKTLERQLNMLCESLVDHINTVSDGNCWISRWCIAFRPEL